MSGTDGIQESLFTVAKLEDFVPGEHPLRAICGVVNGALAQLNSLFDTGHAGSGRASVAPETLLRAMLIQVLFSVRGERQLIGGASRAATTPMPATGPAKGCASASKHASAGTRPSGASGRRCTAAASAWTSTSS